MRYAVIVLILLIAGSAFGWWAASQHHKPEIEAKRIKSLAQLGPSITHCLQPIDVDCIVDDPR